MMIKLLTAGTTTHWSKLAWNLTLKYPSILARMSSLPLLLDSLRAKIAFPKFDNDPSDLELLKWATKQQLPPLWLQRLPSLGWTVGHQHISLWRYTVRHGTRILTRADQAERQDRCNRWLAEIDPTSPSIPLHRVLARLRLLPREVDCLCR